MTNCDKSLESSEFQNLDLHFTTILNILVTSDAYKIVWFVLGKWICLYFWKHEYSKNKLSLSFCFYKNAQKIYSNFKNDLNTTPHRNLNFMDGYAEF